ncbi:unnamed protein product [Oikopleura dioica]|uniref:Uncharacterized protein n=1 Tax=Oikopleura dioica TaxID=34765 RepID=E4XTB7_OIKDI|nr:unnamed protein product [Oikopleura dioica]
MKPFLSSSTFHKIRPSYGLKRAYGLVKKHKEDFDLSSGDGFLDISFDETTVKAEKSEFTTQSNYRIRPPYLSSPTSVTATRTTVTVTPNVPKTTISTTASISTTVTHAKKITVTAHNFDPAVVTTPSTVGHTVETSQINNFSNVLNILLPALIALIIAVSILKGTQHF